jgi:hypothetical protein
MAVCAENSDSDVLVIQTADHGMGHDASDPLNWAREWRMLGQGAVRSLLTCTKIEPTFEETLGDSMTKTLTALIVVATLATATAAVPTTAQERCVGCGIGAPEYPIAPPGYVYYPAYWEPLPGANCYWFRIPAYDAHGNMVGWRGRPEAFCSWLSGYRPWPLR